jgi:hypothetical protein
MRIHEQSRQVLSWQNITSVRWLTKRLTSTLKEDEFRRYRMSRRSGIRFADKDMRQQENLRRIPFILDH